VQSDNLRRYHRIAEAQLIINTWLITPITHCVRVNSLTRTKSLVVTVYTFHYLQYSAEAISVTAIITHSGIDKQRKSSTVLNSMLTVNISMEFRFHLFSSLNAQQPA